MKKTTFAGTILLIAVMGCGLMPAAGPLEESPAADGYIDTHMHLGGLADFGVRPSLETYLAAAENLVRTMDELEIEKAVVVTVPAKTPGGGTGVGDREFIIEAVAQHPGRLFLMDGGATLKPIIEATDPSAVTPQLQADFERQAEEILDAGAIGFGEMISLHFCLSANHSYQWTPADHPLFLALADVAARRDVPIDIHMEVVPEEIPTPANLLQACSQNPARLPASLSAFERLLAHNREAKIVWQHIGWDNIGYMTVELLRSLLEAHPNLYLSLRVEQRTVTVGSQNQPMPNRIVDEAGRIKAEWLALIADFPDRFLVGSDEFIGSAGGLTNRPSASFRQTWAMIAQLPPDLARKVGRENALRVYGLK
jgi:hypothetical protein